ncbi:PepSY domain-containing protein [Hydrogenophaga sp.]|uniref:PepSY domain-containing protein n=1 Tax=Hydrogenophaga sp. TaxID=1904254 RepID=UPI00286E50D5|nr:PepSY domain-containing protein [Hydrogenophaga sp.]
MKSLMLSIAAVLVSGAALAGPACNVPKDQWLPEAGFKKDLQAQGYQIKTFKVSKGQCYEIYGFDKAGKKVEIYFDPATGKPIESK